MKGLLAFVDGQLGALGAAALALLAAGAAFLVLAVQPLEEEQRRLDEQIRLAARGAPSHKAQPAGASAKLAAFYAFFRRGEEPTDWLAKLYGSGKAAGLELRSADYRMVETPYPLLRYEISLPVTGSYAQIRAFLASALDSIPTLSLDRVGFRRKRAGDAVVEADLTLTLYLPKP
jgi:hypothetical protein